MIGQHSKSVNVDKEKLLSILKTNLAAHKLEYAEALAEYKVRLIKDLEQAKKKLLKSSDASYLKFTFNLPKPVNYEKAYQDVIDMLEYSTDTVINLDEGSFKQYIMNDWGWKQMFNHSKALYETAGASYVV